MLTIEALEVSRFRNLDHLTLRPSPRFTVISGENGQGKSNILEAIYAGLSSKSFRTSKLTDLVPHTQVAQSEGLTRVHLEVREGDVTRAQVFALQRGLRAVRIDGKRPPSLASFATATPVVVFHPGELTLTLGPSSERRRLLDRVALHMTPVLMSLVADYTRAARSRQKLLATRGVSAPGLDDWEDVLVRHGVALMDLRERATTELVPHALEFFSGLFGERVTCAMRYVPGAPRDSEAFRARLSEDRPLDMRRKSASTGPHRDELHVQMNAGTARATASQGQHRALCLSLKAAEMETLRRLRGVQPVLLLDDVSSELDEHRTARFFELLHARHGQVLLTTTRPEMVSTGHGERVDWRVREGSCNVLK
jgi:DNA replication and repair protein RecF